MSYINGWITIAIILAYAFTIASCIIVVLSENRNPIRSLAWVIALIFLPVIGLVFYLFFGRSLKGLHLMSTKNKRRLLSSMTFHSADINNDTLSDSERQLIKLARNTCSSYYTVNNRLEIFTDGKSKFDALRKDILAAKKSIFLQYYIFSDDNLGQEIADILKKKASEGVDVRVIYDHVGSFSAKNRFFKSMQEYGVDCHPFFKVTFPQLANRINWRNHRKIVVIDDTIGYIGGMNIADRYTKGLADGGVWRDTHFRVEGDIVEQLLASFVVDWNFMNQPNILSFPTYHHKVEFHNETGMQLVTSGPSSNWDNLSLCFLKAISSAKKSIYIQTPYFLPTDALIHALEAAALSKVDVRIMLPRESDSKMLQLASFSYVTQCLHAGIKVYLYEPGMLHAKAMIIDDNFVTAGSTNFDFRSFENNFECNMLIYDCDINSRMRDIFFSDIEKCTKLTFNTWKRRPRLQRTLESLVRLMAPIL